MALVLNLSADLDPRGRLQNQRGKALVIKNIAEYSNRTGRYPRYTCSGLSQFIHRFAGSCASGTDRNCPNIHASKTNHVCHTHKTLSVIEHEHAVELSQVVRTVCQCGSTARQTNTIVTTIGEVAPAHIFSFSMVNADNEMVLGQVNCARPYTLHKFAQSTNIRWIY